MLPARFTILAGDKLRPPAVYAPAHIPIELIIVSGDGRSHRVVLHTPRLRSLTVAPHGRAEKLIPALRAGTYALYVDGKARGALHIGGAPGP